MKLDFDQLKIKLIQHLDSAEPFIEQKCPDPLSDDELAEKMNYLLSTGFSGLELPEQVFSALSESSKKISNPQGKQFKLNGLVTSHQLINTDRNQWHVMEKTAHEGGLGRIYYSSLKIILDEDKATLVACNDVIKEHFNSRGITRFFEIMRELKLQNKQNVRVGSKLIEVHNKIYTTMENCGINLEDYINDNSFDFDERMQIALAVANEMLQIKKYGIIHRDIKPSNVCIKRFPVNGSWIARLIDFGLAEYKDLCVNQENRLGTLEYMAPELYDMHYTEASDSWAFGALLGELLDADDPDNQVTMFHKRSVNFDLFEADPSKEKLRELLNTTYDYSDLFKNKAIPDDVDDQLLQDIKKVLESYQDIQPEMRPPIEFFLRFQLLMVRRRAIYREIPGKVEFNQQKNQIQAAQFKIGRCYQDTAYNFTVEEADSHCNIVIGMMLQNDVMDYPNPFKPVDENEAARAEHKLELISQFKASFKDFREQFDSEKFTDCNSSGLSRLQTICHSDLSLIKRLHKLKKLGEQKTELGFWYTYSHSSFFGKGRHSNMELLYQKLANLDLDVDNLAEVTAQLQELTDFIEENDFVHRSSQSRLGHDLTL